MNVKGKYLNPKADLTFKRVIAEDALKKGRAEGRAEGLAEGRAEAIKENARNLKANGVSVEVIAKSLGLTAAEIEAL